MITCAPTHTHTHTYVRACMHAYLQTYIRLQTEVGRRISQQPLHEASRRYSKRHSKDHMDIGRAAKLKHLDTVTEYIGKSATVLSYTMLRQTHRIACPLPCLALDWVGFGWVGEKPPMVLGIPPLEIMNDYA